jgi:hypothetical protein
MIVKSMKSQIKNSKEWAGGCSSVVEHSPTIHKSPAPPPYTHTHVRTIRRINEIRTLANTE